MLNLFCIASCLQSVAHCIRDRFTTQVRLSIIPCFPLLYSCNSVLLYSCLFIGVADEEDVSFYCASSCRYMQIDNLHVGSITVPSSTSLPFCEAGLEDRNGFVLDASTTPKLSIFPRDSQISIPILPSAGIKQDQGLPMPSHAIRLSIFKSLRESLDDLLHIMGEPSAESGNRRDVGTKLQSLMVSRFKSCQPFEQRSCNSVANSYPALMPELDLIPFTQCPMPLSFLQVDLPIQSIASFPMTHNVCKASVTPLSIFWNHSALQEAEAVRRIVCPSTGFDINSYYVRGLTRIIEMSCCRLYWCLLPRMILARLVTETKHRLTLRSFLKCDSVAIVSTFTQERLYKVSLQDTNDALDYLIAAFLLQPGRGIFRIRKELSEYLKTLCCRFPAGYTRTHRAVLYNDILSYQPPKRSIDPFVNTPLLSRGRCSHAESPINVQRELPAHHDGQPSRSAGLQGNYGDEEILELNLSDDDVAGLKAFMDMKRGNKRNSDRIDVQADFNASAQGATQATEHQRKQSSARFGTQNMGQRASCCETVEETVIGEQKKRKSGPSILVAPDTLVTSKWALDVASQCIQVGRSMILIPPPLSMLPSVAIAANSYLADLNADHRVLILCGGGHEVVQHVYTYFHSVLGTRYRICQVCSTDLWTAEQASSRMIVTSSIAGIRLSGISFSLVVLVIPCDLTPRIDVEFEEELNALATDQQRNGICSEPTTVMAISYPSCVDLELLASALQSLWTSFRIDTVVCLDQTVNQQVRDCLALAKPSHLFIVLPPDEAEAVRKIEEHAFPLLNVYWRDQSARLHSVVPPDLSSLDLEVITESMNDMRLSTRQSSLTMHQLVLLNILKRAVMFVSNHCVSAGVSFLLSASKHYSDDILESCIERCSSLMYTSAHAKNLNSHRTGHIATLLETLKANMYNEDIAVSASRIQRRFCALVIAESSKTADSLHQELKGSRDVEALGIDKVESSDNLQESELYVAHVGQLDCSTAQQSAAVEFFAQFSHIVQLSEAVSSFTCCSTPVPAEQLAQSSALSLVKVSVDTTKHLEDSLSRAEEEFGRVCSILAAKNGGSEKQNQFAMSDFIRSVSQMNKLATSTLNDKRCAYDEENVDLSKLALSIGIIARQSVDRLAGILFAKLRGVAEVRRGVRVRRKCQAVSGSNIFPYLKVIVAIPRGSRCNAVQILLGAVAHHDYLSSHVEIETEFEPGASNRVSSVTESEFRQPKRQRVPFCGISSRTQAL
jgi:hypothetical protein